MRTRIMVYNALIVLAVMGAGCANESSLSAPEPVAPSCVLVPDDASIDAEFLERFATMRVSFRRVDEPVLAILPPVDDPRAMVCPTPGGTAR